MSIIEIIPFFIKTTGLVLFTEQLIKKDTTLTLYSLSFVFSFIIYLNFILLLIYPDGIWINENGGELFGWSWAKKAAREKQIATETGVIEES